tara:strand:- start:6052 stop:6453 length:402 start_codon:yes stop_codon:yes gene_type:complete
MKFSNGNILIFLGIIHSLLAISPAAFGTQFASFADGFFFKISDGLVEFPILNGQMNYENFAAFCFFYFGLILIPVGFLAGFVEKGHRQLPNRFLWSYLIVVLIGVFMIPLSGMTFLMFPHAIYMLYQNNKKIL